ncbi:DDE-type integrase/transposase/recombinase [Haloactinomyces albus]|uniref:Transposase n=1 Tax=Haloactinomyces albus TaxID=1352928 RepID=A0AAE4CNJ3_9ACTN|nr:DDE-type integrase/transposase/recombinase [Haloactinomyces albus]MDR7304495.1 putative transposase [Haloactinomyces albus]
MGVGGVVAVAGARGGPRGPRVPAAERARIIERLVRLQQAGQLSSEHVRTAAQAVGVSARTVQRWLQAGPRPDTGVSPRRYVLSASDRAAFEDFRGNVSAVHRARQAAVAGHTTAAGVPIAEHLLAGWQGAAPVALRTLYAAFEREMTSAERAYWRSGHEARAERRVYGQRHIARRNAIWQVDHTELDIVVVPPRGNAVRPWLTTFVDLATRVVLGWAIALRPDAGTTVAALRSALVCEAEATAAGAGGVPAVIECDHGREFLGHALQRPASSLGIVVRPVPPRSGRAKGVIERWHRTIAQMLLSQLPGFTGGPRDQRGRLYGPVRDDAAWRALVPESGSARHLAAMPITTFAAVFAAWVRWFNTEHRHSALAGRSPVQAWRADPSPITVVEAAWLRDMLLTRRGAAVTSKGVRHNGLHYRAPHLQGRVGERVDIGFAPTTIGFSRSTTGGASTWAPPHRSMLRARPRPSSTDAPGTPSRAGWPPGAVRPTPALDGAWIRSHPRTRTRRLSRRERRGWWRPARAVPTTVRR